MKKIFLYFSIVLIMALNLSAKESEEKIETGKVKWQRDYAESLKQAKEKNKPILILFQEVPGWQGCQKFGKEVLSHPLLVEAIEDNFIPVVVYNNKKGKDAEVLKSFKEPAWNYQVIRFLNSDGKDIISRKDKVWTLGAVASRICEALEKLKKTVPAYIKGLALAHDNKNIKDIALSMHCFWTGEMKIGQIEGVVKTEAGFFDKKEVTRIWYDSSVIDLEKLVTEAAKVKCANTLYLASDKEIKKVQEDKQLRLTVKTFDSKTYKTAKASDQKRQILKSPYMKIGLNDYQLTKVNAFARVDEKKALAYLSPRQIKSLDALKVKK